MKKIAFMTIACSLALTSCSDHGLNSDLSQQTQTNAETILGRIDPNQDWSSINSISLSLTADAPLREIVKVQILTQSPFFNNQGKILAEKQVGKGETVTLNFDAPKAYDRLIAACVDGQGHYYVKGFDINQGSLSFKKTANKTRGGATRAADENYPSLSQLTLHSTNTLLSYNAQRAEFIRIAEANNDATMLDVVDKGHISAWKNSGWSDRLWLQDNGETKLNDTWTRKENSIRRANAAFYADAISNPLLELPASPAGATPVWHQYVVRCAQRDRLRQYLADHDIATDVLYPTPPHLQPCYNEYAHLSLPIAERLSREVMSLPVSSALTAEQAGYIARTINDFR